MVDTWRPRTQIEVTQRVWGGVAQYLPHRDGKVYVGVSHSGFNPLIAKEQLYDAFKKAKKASGSKKLDPLIKGGMPKMIVDEAVGDLLGNTTRVASHGKIRYYKNWWASLVGWGNKKLDKTIELPTALPKHRKRRI